MTLTAFAAECRARSYRSISPARTALSSKPAGRLASIDRQILEDAGKLVGDCLRTYSRTGGRTTRKHNSFGPVYSKHNKHAYRVQCSNVFGVAGAKDQSPERVELLNERRAPVCRQIR